MTMKPSLHLLNLVPCATGPMTPADGSSTGMLPSPQVPLPALSPGLLSLPMLCSWRCNGCVGMWGPGDERLPHRHSHPQIHPTLCSWWGMSGSVIEAVTSFGVKGTREKTLHAEKAFSFSLWSISPNAEHIGCCYLQFWSWRLWELMAVGFEMQL